MAWVKMKDALGNVLTIPQATYNDIYKNNSAYKLITEVPTKKETPVVQKTKKTEVKENGTIQEDTKPNGNN